ncbi:hypothetical protein Fcan01_21188 [Folsomia candida]|uniref:Peptidase M28 domain-containing protein n=2 Tax=Folsomia candida TaxID=158441 RepID=A0A226DFR1_FOLCA|nr:hypothetical protein Fcan01_21188 [Folsomia candida]
MEKSWKISTQSVALGVLILTIGASFVSSGEISTKSLRGIFQETNLEVSRDPATYEGRQGIQSFLSWRLSSFVSTVTSSGKAGGAEHNQFLQQNFETKVVFHGSKNASEDAPLVILANYDTDESEVNPVDDNGSGIVALVALAEHVSHQITTGKLVLERTLIFAATDMALSKYEYGLPDGARTGAEALVQLYLPQMMQGRSRFGGAIVLDSIMNYNDEERSQSQYGGLFDKAFPLAYQEMSKRNFKGDFLAMVFRDDELDTPLVQAFERGWRSTSKSMRSEAEVDIDPALVRFSYTQSTFNAHAPSAIHFLHSEQAPFWNHFVPEIHRKLPTKEFPALLLTDTEKYRKAECASSGCTITKMVTDAPKNVEFLKRTVNALYATIIDLQVDGNRNSAPTTAGYSSLFSIIVGIVMHRVIFL